MDDRHQRFRTFYNQTYDDLWRYCLRRCATREHAEDLLGESYAVAWRRFDDVPEPPGSRPYLFGIARNLLRNDLRRVANQRQLTERLKAAVLGRAPAVAIDAARPDDIDTVLSALHQLSEADQEVLRLAAWEQLPHAEIADILGCSVNAVAIRLHRARDRLATHITLADDRTAPAATPNRRNAQ